MLPGKGTEGGGAESHMTQTSDNAKSFLTLFLNLTIDSWNSRSFYLGPLLTGYVAI
jgi:hypothetical protein